MKIEQMTLDIEGVETIILEDRTGQGRAEKRQLRRKDKAIKRSVNTGGRYEQDLLPKASDNYLQRR